MPEVNFCPYCGTKLLHEGARFCPSCGRSLVDGQEVRDPGRDVRQGSRISGTITDPRGQPLERAEIEVSGVSLAGERVRYTAKSDATGTYFLPVARGVYNIYAVFVAHYQGKRWRLRLHPCDEDNEMVSAGHEPIVKDFQWRLAGLIPGANSTVADSYYGGSLWIRCSSSVDDDRLKSAILSEGPERSVCTFTLTPAAPLIDGSPGEVLTMTRTVKSLWSTEDDVDLETTPYLYDIPLGQYMLMASLSFPGWPGRTVPVPLNADGGEWQDTVDVSFEPNGVTWGTEQNIILLGLPDQ